MKTGDFRKIYSKQGDGKIAGKTPNNILRYIAHPRKHVLFIPIIIAVLLTMTLLGCSAAGSSADLGASGEPGVTTQKAPTNGEDSGGFSAETSSTVTVDIQE